MWVRHQKALFTARQVNQLFQQLQYMMYMYYWLCTNMDAVNFERHCKQSNHWAHLVR